MTRMSLSFVIPSFVAISMTAGAALAQLPPVDVSCSLDHWSNVTIVVSPTQPARVYWLGMERNPVVEIRVQSYAADELWWCVIEDVMVPGVAQLVLEMEQPGATLTGAPYPLLEPTNANGAGRFDCSVLRGGGQNGSGRLQFRVPERDACGTSFEGRITSPDLNGDLSMNVADLALFAHDYRVHDQRSDFNGDRAVDLGDLVVFASYYLAP